MLVNPFQYGSLVEGSFFCNREQEQADLTAHIHNGDKIFVHSERRLGKTSLVQQVLHNLPPKRYASAYVDLWPTDGEQSFTLATARAIAESMSGTVEQVLEVAKQLFTRLTPTITTDAEGKPRVNFGIAAGAQPGPDLDEVLAAPEKIAKRGKRRVVMVFDEIQQILEYQGDFVERKLRSIIQHQTGIAYIFLGSRKHLIQRMFLDRSRPLYRSAGHYPLGPIATKHWLPFIEKKFNEGGRSISREVIEEVCRLSEGHPFYTQHICHALWELSETKRPVTVDLTTEAVNILIDRESYAYTAMWESLTINQKRLLKGLASEASGAKPFSGAFVQKYGLTSPSNSQRSADALLNRDLIDRDRESFTIVDRFFRIWILRRQIL
jgi:hypothetical protein